MKAATIGLLIGSILVGAVATAELIRSSMPGRVRIEEVLKELQRQNQEMGERLIRIERSMQ